MAEEKRPDAGEFRFVQEKIKQSGSRKGKFFKKASLTVLFAVVFGAVAAVTFVFMYPWAQEKFGEEPVKEISIPKDEEEAVPEEETSAMENPEEQEPEATEPETAPVDPEQDSQAEDQGGDQAGEVPEVIPWEIGLADYASLIGQMREVGRAAGKAMVLVTAETNDTDWFNALQANKCETSGLLIGNNGVEQLILTTFSAIEGAENLRITFADRSEGAAVLKAYDRVTDLAVLAVNLADISEETLSQIEMVNWGNSNIVKVMEPVIAVGCPVGLPGSVLFGNITAITFDEPVVDGEYQLLLTNMNRTESGSGALVNFQGEVVGWIQNRYLHANNEHVMTAYGISDLKMIIEHLCNNQDIAYLGVVGADMTKAMMSEMGVSGVYIMGVEMDSPAMLAGMQSGDMMVDISGQKVRSVEEMRSLLLNFSSEQKITIKVMRKGKEGLKELYFDVMLTALK